MRLHQNEEETTSATVILPSFQEAATLSLEPPGAGAGAPFEKPGRAAEAPKNHVLIREKNPVRLRVGITYDQEGDVLLLRPYLLN